MAGRRLRPWIVIGALVAALPAFGPVKDATASGPTKTPPAIARLASPFQPLSKNGHAASNARTFHAGGSEPVHLRGRSNEDVAGVIARGTPIAPSAELRSNQRVRPLDATTPPEDLTQFVGTTQATAIQTFGPDQEVTPPNDDIAAGPTDLVEVANSTIVVLSRTGATVGSADLNDFMDVTAGYHSSDPRVIYDPGGGRFWLTITEVPNDFVYPNNCPPPAPVLIAVSPSSNPLPFNQWLVYSLPIGIQVPNTMFGDQPGLGDATNTIAVTFDDYDCQLNFLGSEVDILQKTDFEHDSGNHSLQYFIGGPFAPQPVQEYGSNSVQYVVTNQADCDPIVCGSPPAGVRVDIFNGTPEMQDVTRSFPTFPPMTPTAVDDATGFLPPADQPSPGPQLQTNDDRFLNAVWENGEIWTADGTSCEPPGDTVQRDCLDYVEIAADNAGNVSSTLTNQINNVGIDGADLYYPAVTVDAAGDLITVFDESSVNLDPSIVDATVATGATTLSDFQTLLTSEVYYNGDDLFLGACDDTEGCRWGDYSGAAQDPVHPEDVWTVSEADFGDEEGACDTVNACWDTAVDLLTDAAPTITALTPATGPVAGGGLVIATGTDFNGDAVMTVTVDGADVSGFDLLSPESVRFIMPAASSTAGGPVQVQANGPNGSSVEDAASTYTYIGLANYVALNPFRIMDTRTPGGALGAGAVRLLRVTGVGATPIPSDATAVVLNVTEVNGSANSLLTLYPFGTVRPNASNLNFNADTVIANLVTVEVGTSGGQGWVDIYNALGSVNVLADVEGYFTPEPSSDFTGLFHPMAPLRVCDTRKSCEGNVALRAEQPIVVNVTGVSGIPSDGTAGAAVLNVTGVSGSASTYLSVFPTDSSGGCQYTGSHAPPVSTLNLTGGAVIANRLMVELGPAFTGGPNTSVCVYNSAGTINLVLDANGWYGSSTATATPAGYQYQAIAPLRICDTRVGSDTCTKGAIGASLARLIGVDGVDAIPSRGSPTTIAAIIANLTAVAPTAATYLTLYPANLPKAPTVSDLNVNAGEVLPNLVVVAVDVTGATTHGYVDLFNDAGSVNAVMDVEGWFQ